MAAKASGSDSLAMQLYKSLTDEQKAKVCLPVDHPRRQWIDNWWYIHPEYRIPNTFSSEQREAIQTLFDSLHSPGDIDATIGLIEKKNVVDRLHITWYDGKYDVGSDQVWDTWQIEGPDMVWYFRGVPHIHCYFHLKA